MDCWCGSERATRWPTWLRRTTPRWVVVARAGLGTLNHAELTVAALKSRGQDVAGVVVGEWPEQPGIAEEENLVDLPRVTGVPLLGRIPAGAAALPVRAFRRGALDWVPAI